MYHIELLPHVPLFTNNCPACLYKVHGGDIEIDMHLITQFSFQIDRVN